MRGERIIKKQTKNSFNSKQKPSQSYQVNFSFVFNHPTTKKKIPIFFLSLICFVFSTLARIKRGINLNMFTKKLGRLGTLPPAEVAPPANLVFFLTMENSQENKKGERKKRREIGEKEKEKEKERKREIQEKTK